MPQDTPNWTPTELNSIQEAANKAPGSTIDFMVAHADLGLTYRLSGYYLYIHPSFGLSLQRKMVDAAYMAIALPTGTSVGHLLATLFACPLPALILYYMRNGESDEGESTWDEIFHDAGRKFIGALKRFNSRELQDVIAKAIDEAAWIVADIKLDDSEADAGAVPSDEKRSVEE